MHMLLLVTHTAGDTRKVAGHYIKCVFLSFVSHLLSKPLSRTGKIPSFLWMTYVPRCPSQLGYVHVGGCYWEGHPAGILLSLSSITIIFRITKPVVPRQEVQSAGIIRVISRKEAHCTALSCKDGGPRQAHFGKKDSFSWSDFKNTHNDFIEEFLGGFYKWKQTCEQFPCTVSSSCTQFLRIHLKVNIN